MSLISDPVFSDRIVQGARNVSSMDKAHPGTESLLAHFCALTHRSESCAMDWDRSRLLSHCQNYFFSRKSSGEGVWDECKEDSFSFLRVALARCKSQSKANNHSKLTGKIVLVVWVSVPKKQEGHTRPGLKELFPDGSRL